MENQCETHRLIFPHWRKPLSHPSLLTDVAKEGILLMIYVLQVMTHLRLQGEKIMKRLRLFDTGSLSDTASRRVLMTPSYAIVIWRWSMWLYALIVILSSNHSPPNNYFNVPLAIILFSITFGLNIIVT